MDYDDYDGPDSDDADVDHGTDTDGADADDGFDDMGGFGDDFNDDFGDDLGDDFFDGYEDDLDDDPGDDLGDDFDDDLGDDFDDDFDGGFDDEMEDIDPDAVEASDDPEDLDDPDDSDDDGDLDEPGETNEPGDLDEPDGADEPGEPGDNGDLDGPAEPGGPGDLDEPGETDEPEDSDEPEAPEDTGEVSDAEEELEEAPTEPADMPQEEPLTEEELREAERLADDQRDPTLSEEEREILEDMERRGETEVLPTELGPAIRSSENPLMTADVHMKDNSANASYTTDQFVGQAQLQEDGFANLTVAEYVDNIQAYKEHGRDKSAAQEQQDYRTGLKEGIIEDLREAGTDLSPEELEAAAKAEMAKGAALHGPDLRAGGAASGINGYGNAAANSSLGSQWAHGQADSLYDQVMAQIEEKGMTREEMESTYMDVHIHVD